LIVNAEKRVGEVSVVSWRGGEFFVVTGDVIPGVSNGASEETRKVGWLSCLVSGEKRLQLREGVHTGHVACTIGIDDLDLVIFGLENGDRGGSEKGIASDFFTAYDTFQKKGVVGVSCNSVKSGNGG